jgi:MFS family permease
VLISLSRHQLRGLGVIGLTPVAQFRYGLSGSQTNNGGVGAALILPSIVALVAGNFPAERHPAAYGLVAAAGAIAVALGPLIGGLATTYASWRWVFVGEVVLVLVILVLARRAEDAPRDRRPQIDVIGAVLPAVGLGVFVFGVLKSGSWGWVVPKSGAPHWFGISPVPGLMVGGLGLVWSFLRWEARRVARGKEPLVDPALLRNEQLDGGLTMFFFQYLLHMGIFFLIPLYLSVALGLSAIATGVRMMPLSITLLAAALLIPRLWPNVSRRLVVRAGIFAMLLGTVSEQPSTIVATPARKLRLIRSSIGRPPPSETASCSIAATAATVATA